MVYKVDIICLQTALSKSVKSRASSSITLFPSLSKVMRICHVRCCISVEKKFWPDFFWVRAYSQEGDIMLDILIISLGTQGIAEYYLYTITYG